MSLTPINDEGYKMKTTITLAITVVLLSAYTVNGLLTKVTEVLSNAINGIA